MGKGKPTRLTSAALFGAIVTLKWDAFMPVNAMQMMSMPTTLQSVLHWVMIGGLQFFYVVSVVGLAIYGAQATWLTIQYLISKRPPITQSPNHQGDWPAVTIQLPIYNERHVVERLIDACANLDYPRDRLQIQILDDSTDQTTAIALRRAEFWRQQGCNIQLVQRADRSGYKAGALAHALPCATGDFIAIFDADFAPPADFLRRIIPTFMEPQGERIAFVQARWGHLNADYSPLTHCQALALDGHFVVEQGGRQAAGYAIGFNGSGGVWRRAAIVDQGVGGWQADTLCEDLDLSYRAQLAGWRYRYTNKIEAPAEVPPQLIAFKRQQFRWAKGSMQTLRKLGAAVWQSEWPLPKRLAGLAHMGGYLIHPLLLLLLLTTLPILLLDINPGRHIALLSLASLGPPLLYAVGQIALHGRGWWRHWRYLPLLTLLGTGLCFSNTVAVWQGWFNQGGAFLRTPKFHVETRGDGWHGSSYQLPLDRTFLGELGLLVYAVLTTWLAAHQAQWMLSGYLLLYVGGFGLLIGVSLWQARPRRAVQQNHTTPTSAAHSSAQRPAAP